MTLLEKAKSSVILPKKSDGRVKHNWEELVELAIAYANGEVKGPQVKEALRTGDSCKTNIQSLLASTLMSAVRRGEIRVEKVLR